MSDASAAPGRPMKYPYTLTAKLAQFPFKYHWNNVWLFRYWLIAVGVTAPVFYKIGKMTTQEDEKKRGPADFSRGAPPNSLK